MNLGCLHLGREWRKEVNKAFKVQEILLFGLLPYNAGS